MLNNKKFAMGFICIGIVAIVAAVFVSAFNPKTYSTDVPAELDEAVALSIFAREHVSPSDVTIDGKTYRYAAVGGSKSFFGSECMGESHMVLGFSKNDSHVEVYALCGYSGYGFVNGILVDNTGASCVPTLIQFDVKDGRYIFKDAQEAKDGGQFVPSVRNMFPAALAKKAIDAPTDSELTDSMLRQCEAYAEAYLKVIGREAKISSFADEDFKLLSDFGVSSEVENALYELHPEYGLYVGNFENIEDVDRYVYSQEWKAGDEEGSGTVVYTKTDYKTGKAAQKFTYKVKGSEFEEVKPKSKTKSNKKK